MILRRLLFGCAIFAITIAVFARLTTCEFTWWDDQDTVHQNPRLNPPTSVTLSYYWTTAGEQTTMGLYVPVTYTVWSGIAHFARLDRPNHEGITLNAAAFHTANVLLHALTAAVVFMLLARLFSGDVAALLGALLFALHPVQVESVGWVSGTKDLLCGLFGTLALLMYVRSIQASVSPRMIPSRTDEEQPVLDYAKRTVSHNRLASRLFYWLGIFFFCLGMLSKPTAVVIPLMAGSISIFLFDRSVRRTISSLIPWFVLMIPCMVWTKLVQPATWVSPLPLWARPAVAADAMAFYFYKLLWPIHLCIDYGRNPQAILDHRFIFYTWLVPAVVIVLLWRNAARCRPAIAAALLFVCPLLPVLGFVGFEFQQISTTSDHYLYLPMLGLAVLVAWILCESKSPARGVVVVIILLALGARTIAQQAYWQTSRTLFLHALDVNPRSVASCDGLGFVTGRDARRLDNPSQRSAALELFNQSIGWYQKSLEIENNSVPSLYNLALDYKAIGRADIGREKMHEIYALQPALQPGLRVEPMTLARRLCEFPDLPDGIACLNEVIRNNPRDITAIMLREQAMAHLRDEMK